MTNDEIITIAREAGIERWWDEANARQDTYEVSLAHFAELVAAAEREACAEVCAKLIVPRQPLHKEPGRAWIAATLDCAAAIRARGAA